MKNEGLHYKRLPRFVVRWKGSNRKKVLEFCKGAAKIEGNSVFIDTTEAKKGDYIIKYIINKRENFLTANQYELKCLRRMRKNEKSRRYPVDIHSLNVWARYLLKKNEKTWIKLL